MFLSTGEPPAFQTFDQSQWSITHLGSFWFIESLESRFSSAPIKHRTLTDNLQNSRLLMYQGISRLFQKGWVYQFYYWILTLVFFRPKESWQVFCQIEALEPTSNFSIFVFRKTFETSIWRFQMGNKYDFLPTLQLQMYWRKWFQSTLCISSWAKWWPSLFLLNMWIQTQINCKI